MSPDTNSQNRTATYPHIDYEPMGIWLFDTVVLYPEGDATDHLYATKTKISMIKSAKCNIFELSENDKQTCPMLNTFDLSGFNVRRRP